MQKLVKIFSFALAGSLGGVTAVASTIVTLTPAIISPVGTAPDGASSFSDAGVTLTPLVGGFSTVNGSGIGDPSGATGVTFNRNDTRLGVDDVPVGTAPATNANAFNDRDTNPANGNEEMLRFSFQPLTGLHSISYDFSRADALAIVNDAANTSDGVFISGFLFDPGVSFTVVSGTAPTAPNFPEAFWNSSTNTVRLDIKGGGFSGALIRVNFADPNASLGQVLSLRATDSDQAGAQLAIREIQYNAVPEPATFLLATLLAGLGYCARCRTA